MIKQRQFDPKQGGLRGTVVEVGVEEALERNGMWLERVDPTPAPRPYWHPHKTEFFVEPYAQLHSGARSIHEPDVEACRVSGIRQRTTNFYLLPDGTQIAWDDGTLRLA